MRVVVVGAGVFGLSGAIALAERGHQVRVLSAGALDDADHASSDSSRAARADYGDDAFYTDLALRALRAWPRWGSVFHRSGFLFATQAALEDSPFEWRSFCQLRGRGAPVQRLRGEALSRRFPLWRDAGFADGYLSQAAGWIDADAVLASLRARARAARVELCPHTLIRAIEPAAARIALRGPSTHLSADHVVLATGAWTPSLWPELADRLRATAQPVLYLRPEQPERFAAAVFPPFGADLARSGWYGFSATASGLVKIANHGPGAALGPEDPRDVPAAFEAEVRAFLARRLPALRDAPCARARVCFYTDSFDGDFWITRHPEHARLSFATGGSGHGFKFTPLLGSIIADVVEGRANPAAARFAWRPPGPWRTEEARRD